MGRRATLSGLALLSTLVLSPAEASLTLCNRTSYVLYAATASLSLPDVVLQGWTRLAPGACELALKGDLSAEATYVYARTSRAHSAAPRAWSGQVNLCVKDSSFALRQPFGARCPADGYELAFAQIDTHHMRSWTTTFRETPDLPSMLAAERAGLKRLLGDTGVRTNDKQVEAALGQLRKRLHLQNAAPAATLFSALETEAMKVAVPVGYTVCNDSDKAFWTAVGQQKGTTFSSKGWWTVAGGSCSHLITDLIAGSRVWLRVERSKGNPLVFGPMPFCVTNIEFDVQGRANCAKRGLTEAGFMETNIKGLPGYTAHVSATGLAVK